MAFEAFLDSDDLRPRRRRRMTYVVSLIIHGVLLAAGVAYSFWRVEEISPPTVRVTFMSSVPPPPAPPPPPASGGSPAVKKKTAKTRVSPTELVQPTLIPPKKEDPKTAPPDDDDPDQAFAGGNRGSKTGAIIDGKQSGNENGKEGSKGHGPLDGVDNGSALAKPPAPRPVPPQMGALHKASGEDPDFPAVLRRRAGMIYVVETTICVSRTGSVDSVTITKSADSLLDVSVVKAVKGWRYRPMLANSNAVPFCYQGRFEFKSD